MADNVIPQHEWLKVLARIRERNPELRALVNEVSALERKKKHKPATAPHPEMERNADWHCIDGPPEEWRCAQCIPEFGTVIYRQAGYQPVHESTMDFMTYAPKCGACGAVAAPRGL